MASNDYKKFDREIKGYVEALYNIQSYNNEVINLFYENGEKLPTVVNANYTQSIIETFNTNRMVDNYAILNDNYTKLDGSFILFNKVSNDCGFYSSENVECYNAPLILFIGSSSSPITVDTTGITLYTKNNNIISCNAYLRDLKTNLITSIEVSNSSDCLIIDFQTSIKGNYIIIENIKFEYENRRVALSHFDFGLSYIYKDEELIEFTVTEQVDKLVEETPTNELNLLIGDYKELYNPLNPNKISKYLTDNSKFVPYIGIVNSTGIVEYTKMGEFFFKKIDYQDKEVTFTAYNLMDQLNKIFITNTNGTLCNESGIIPKNGLASYLQNYLNNNYGSNYLINISNKIRMYLKALKRVSLAEFLQQASMIDGIFYVDRDNNIVIRSIDKTIIEVLSKNELLKELKYINEKVMTSINLERNVFTLSATEEVNNANNFSITFNLEEETQDFCITSDDVSVLSWLADEHLTVTGATSFNIIKADSTKNDFSYMLFVHVEGTIGSQITINAKYPYKKDKSTSTEITKIGNGEALLTINNPFYVVPYHLYDDMFTNFFDKAYSYSASFDYNGNPYIKAGDYIEAESNYGYVSLFVTKHTLKFNGGLSGSIEGVE